MIAAKRAAQAERDAQVAQTARLKKQRNKAKAKARREARREQASPFVTQPYGGEETLAQKVETPMWGLSSKTDLKMGYIKLASEVTHRSAATAREDGRHTKEVNLHFAGTPHAVSVLSGSNAARMTPTERSIDLIVLLREGLTEEKFATLVRRWSKRVAREGEERAMEDEDDDM